MYQTNLKYNTESPKRSTQSSTGKKRDSETGYSYFGARYYDSDLMTGWLSVDPMADKYPNISPYAYCGWNPVRLVDPDGRDWYQNELTGAIYYNIKIRGAESAGTGAMKGDGWKYLGENNMFTTDGFNKSDWDIIRRNNGKYAYNKYSNSFDMELSLNGDRVKSVMEFVGYKQVPIQTVSYNDTYTQTFVAGPGRTISITYGHICEYVEKVAYVPQYYQESKRSIVGSTVYGDYNPLNNNTPFACREKINYSDPGPTVRFFKGLFAGLTHIHGGIHNYSNYYNMGSIKKYSGNNKLINKILKK